MKWFLLTIAILFMLLLAAVFFRNLTPPTFTLRQLETTTGNVRIAIEPNFIVNSIYAIEVAHADRTLLSRKVSKEGRQVLDIPGELRSGDVLSVRCDLQYDQWIAACITTIEKQIVLY